jgi:hypothetical protein
LSFVERLNISSFGITFRGWTMMFLSIKFYSSSLRFQRAQDHQKWSSDAKVLEVFVLGYLQSYYRKFSARCSNHVFLKRYLTGITPVVPVRSSTGATTRSSAPGRILAATVGFRGTYLRGASSPMTPNLLRSCLPTIVHLLELAISPSLP